MPPASLSETGQAEREKLAKLHCRVFCCASTGCLSSGSQTVLDALNQAITSRNLGDRVQVVPTGCMGLCSLGPLVRVEVRDRAPVLYKSVDPLVARLIVAEHVVPALAAVEAGEDFPPPLFLSDYMVALDLPFFTLQTKVALSDTGRINPERIELSVEASRWRSPSISCRLTR